jgi:hypothetical protein
MRMSRLTPQFSAVLVASALGVLAAALWFGLRSREMPSAPSQRGFCEEWERAEVANQGPGWDLTYESLLKRSGVCPGDTFCEILAKRSPPPVGEHLGELRGDAIISSMLMELPGGHAEMAATLFVRTKDQAYALAKRPNQAIWFSEQPIIPAADYDRVFESMACWRQDEPPKTEFGERGYIGFLNLYKEGKSRQMLLTHNDLFEGNTNPDEGKPGRFWKALEPLRPYW